MGDRPRRTARRGPAMVLLAGAVLLALASTALADDDPQPVDFTHNVTAHRRRSQEPCSARLRQAKPGVAICTTPTQTAANVNTDCETTGPHNETSIAVNPTEPDEHHRRRQRLPARPEPGWPRHRDACCRGRTSASTAATRGRSTRSTRTPRTRPPAIRPWPSTPTATRTTQRWASASSARSTRTNPDVLVSNSGDGGKTWSTSRIAPGSGNEDERRRPAGQGVRRGLGPRQRHRHVRRLPARAEGRVRQRAASTAPSPTTTARRGRRRSSSPASSTRRSCRCQRWPPTDAST